MTRAIRSTSRLYIGAATGGSRRALLEFKVLNFQVQVVTLRTEHSVVVGRESALAQLHCWLGKAQAGQRQLVFVTGEPGIGKTTVVEAFLAGLRYWDPGQGELTTQKVTIPAAHPPSPGPWISWGQCIESYGTREAYLPILEALGRLGRGPEGGQFIALLQRHAPTWLVQMPSFLSPHDYQALQRKTQGATQGRMLRELAEALEVITAERPLVLVLEDLHWSDSSTLDLLSLVARRTEPARLLILGTYRPVDVTVREHPLKTIKQELQLHNRCQELALEPLNEAQVVEYLAQRGKGKLSRDHEGAEKLPETERKQAQPLADAPSSDALSSLARLMHHRTEGNPLFLVAMVDDLLARGVIVQTDSGWELRKDAGDIEIARQQQVKSFELRATTQSGSPLAEAR